MLARALLLEIGEHVEPDLLRFSFDDDVRVLQRFLRPQRRVDPAEHHELAATAELVRDLVRVRDAGGLAGERDDVGIGVVVDRLEVLVVERDLMMLRSDAGDGL
jgi:hypothetical protein